MNRIFTTLIALLLACSMPALAETQPNLEKVLQLTEQTDDQMSKWTTLAGNILKLGDAPITPQLSAERDRLMAETAALIASHETEVAQADNEVLSWLKECQTQEECFTMMDSMDPYLEMRERILKGQLLLERVLFSEQFMTYAETITK